MKFNNKNHGGSSKSPKGNFKNPKRVSSESGGGGRVSKNSKGRFNTNKTSLGGSNFNNNKNGNYNNGKNQSNFKKNGGKSLSNPRIRRASASPKDNPNMVKLGTNNKLNRTNNNKKGKNDDDDDDAENANANDDGFEITPEEFDFAVNKKGVKNFDEEDDGGDDSDGDTYGDGGTEGGGGGADLVKGDKKKKKTGGFQSMGLSPLILKGVLRRGYKVPTPIQRKVSFSYSRTLGSKSLESNEMKL
jgi:hypothetical protein